LRWIIPDEFFASNLPNSIGLALILFGIVATYLILAPELGRFGLISFIVAFLGITWITCMIWGLAFFGPVLHDLDPTLTADKSFPDIQSPLNGGLLSAVFLLGIGMILYGLSILISSKSSRLSGLLLILGSIVSFIMVNDIDTAGPILQSIAIIWICSKALQSNFAAIQTNQISG
jgi:hypothetical protein